MDNPYDFQLQCSCGVLAPRQYFYQHKKHLWCDDKWWYCRYCKKCINLFEYDKFKKHLEKCLSKETIIE